MVRSALVALLAPAFFLLAKAAPVPVGAEIDAAIEVRSSLIDLNVAPNVDLSDLVDLEDAVNLSEINVLSAPVNSDHGVGNDNSNVTTD